MVNATSRVLYSRELPITQYQLYMRVRGVLDRSGRVRKVTLRTVHSFCAVTEMLNIMDGSPYMTEVVNYI